MSSPSYKPAEQKKEGPPYRLSTEDRYLHSKVSAPAAVVLRLTLTQTFKLQTDLCTMPRPSKRARTSQLATERRRGEKKLQRDSEVPTCPYAKSGSDFPKGVSQ